MAEIRLDKYLANMAIGTRTEVKSYIRKGLVTVNGVPSLRPEQKVCAGRDKIIFQDQEVVFEAFEYFMLNKPAGYVSAVQDNIHPTVVALINDRKKDIFPVGRLDKDTEGLLLLTNDGELAHALLAPDRHVEKCYAARIQGCVTGQDVQAFAAGLDIGEKKLTRPAGLNILSSGEVSEIEVTICEGKFHQVKRMFAAVDKKVLSLKRIAMGSLMLDPQLAPGEYRRLTKAELDQLKCL